MVYHGSPDVTKHGVASDATCCEDDEEGEVENEEAKRDVLHRSSVAAIGKCVEEN